LSSPAKPATEESAVTPPECSELVPTREPTKFAEKEVEPVTRDPDVMPVTTATLTLSERREFHVFKDHSRDFVMVPPAKRPSLPPLAQRRPPPDKHFQTLLLIYNKVFKL